MVDQQDVMKFISRTKAINILLPKENAPTYPSSTSLNASIGIISKETISIAIARIDATLWKKMM